MSLWPWPSTCWPQYQQGSSCVMSNNMTKFGVPGQSRTQVIERTRIWFHSRGHCDLEVWPADPKNNRDHICAISNILTKFGVHGLSKTQVIERTKIEGTDRPTCAKQYTITSSKGVMIIVQNIIFLIWLHQSFENSKEL